MTNELPYRPCVGVVLANVDGLIFTGERIDTPGAWQMPQGGIDAGETSGEAALRELLEETGVPARLVEMVAETDDWITYELPAHLVGKLWKGRFRGQKQKWVLLAFSGTDEDVDIVQPHQEFARWRWSPANEVLRDIVPFKREVYARVLSAFKEHLK
jgi:putative (di)nucleoside polyphosphate hydrolase